MEKIDEISRQREGYRQSPRRSWVYYAKCYHTQTESGYNAALADARAWGYVLPSEMAAVWNVSPRQARRLAKSLTHRNTTIEYVDIQWYRHEERQIYSKRMILLHPDWMPETVCTGGSSASSSLIFEGSLAAFFDQVERNLAKL